MNQAVLAAKTETVKTITEKAKESQTIIVCEYRGLTVAQIQEVRRALHKENAEMNVYKNSLVERAVDELGYNEMNDILKGPNAIVFSKDVIGGAKVIAKYAKRHKDVLIVKGGVVEGKFVDAAGMLEVAKLPGKEGLISMFLSCLQAPIRSFACAVKAVAAVPREQIEPVLKRMGEIDADMFDRYSVDDYVKVIHGPLEGTEGRILSINRDTKVVELETIFFGRSTKVEVDFSEIDKI